MRTRRARQTASRPIKLSDAARRLGCHVETLRLRIRAGQLKATRGPHGAYYASRVDLAALPRPGQRPPPPPQPQPKEVEASWDQMEQYLEKGRLRLTREHKLFRQVRADPASNRKLYRLIAVNRLGRAGMRFPAIAAKLGISTRQVRRLAERRPLDAFRRDLQTIRSAATPFLRLAAWWTSYALGSRPRVSAITASHWQSPAAGGSGDSDRSTRMSPSPPTRSSD